MSNTTGALWPPSKGSGMTGDVCGRQSSSHPIESKIVMIDKYARCSARSLGLHQPIQSSIWKRYPQRHGEDKGAVEIAKQKAVHQQSARGGLVTVEDWATPIAFILTMTLRIAFPNATLDGLVKTKPTLSSPRLGE
ncbi:hypothetical protein GOP47_0017991 [Adiantum capillus-veneris]|uniref:Uncharacterized protein n=1 Tax=Adiantum capillus-veneris TaxID=13818 RepID=A0A9D4Z9R1_ADICA|nr:hypothetical protein GOP47_0017991 [Adiantum capillus-veneris]